MFWETVGVVLLVLLLAVQAQGVQAAAVTVKLSNDVVGVNKLQLGFTLDGDWKLRALTASRH